MLERDGVVAARTTAGGPNRPQEAAIDPLHLHAFEPTYEGDGVGAAIRYLNEAVAQGFDVSCKVQDYADVAYGWATEDTVGIVKLVSDSETGRLLGAHIMGHQASSIIQPLIQAMTFGLSVHEMARGQYWIHPALPEVIENALLGLSD